MKTYTFTCPTCRKRITFDAPGEPCCTGPSEMRDDHEMQVMRLVSINDDRVSPIFAEQRVLGPLILQ